MGRTDRGSARSAQATDEADPDAEFKRLAREAADPATPAARLQALLTTPPHGEALGRFVAQNPSTPPDALLRLAPMFPDEVLANEAMPLHLLADPGLLLSSSMTMNWLLRCQKPPAWFLEFTVGLWDERVDSYLMRRVGEWLAERPETPRAIVAKLCTCLVPGARQLAASRPDAPAELLQLLVQAGSEPNLTGVRARRPAIEPALLERVAALGPWGASLAASHPNAPTTLLEHLGQSDCIPVVASVARNPHAPIALLDRLARHPSYVVRREVASHRAASDGALRTLSRASEHELVRLVIAHPEAPPDLLSSLAHERSFTGTLAAAPRTPPSLLATYADDRSVYVRRKAASNQATPVEALERFARDPRYEVRLAVLLHPSLPDALLEALCQDRSREVRARAERRRARGRLRRPPRSS